MGKKGTKVSDGTRKPNSRAANGQESSPCPMCHDPNSNKHVENYIRGEATCIEIARAYPGMRQMDVERHIHKHMVTALRPAMRRIMLNPDVSKGLVEAKTQAAFVLVDKLAALSDRLDHLLRSDAGSEACPVCEAVHYNPQQIGAIANLSKALLAYLHELGVWTGDIKSTIFNINVQAQYVEFRTVVLEVLAEHPDVLLKVQDRLAAQLPEGAQN